MVDNRNGNNMYLFLFKENLEILVVMIHISNDKYLFVTPGRYKGQTLTTQKLLIVLTTYCALSLDTLVKRILFTVCAVGNISEGKT